MTSIRPTVPPASQPGATPAGPVRTAAQRAFFEAALGKAAAAPAPSAPAAPAATPVEARAAPAPSEPPRKILRPGSLLDIRV